MTNYGSFIGRTDPHALGRSHTSSAPSSWDLNVPDPKKK